MLAAALTVGSAAFLVRQRQAGLKRRTMLILLALGVVLAPLVSRVFVQLTRYAVRGFGGFVLLSCKPYDYALCGTMLGLFLAAMLTARLTHQRALRVLDALAPAGLLALAVARFGETFSDFGWGQLVLDPRGQLFPVAVQDMYGQWHLAVFMLEGVLALGIGLWAWRLGGSEGRCFAASLLWLSMTQVFCESLRAETIRWGFVRVQQVACAAFGLALLLWVLAGRRRLRAGAACVGVYLAGVAVVALMEYALDKLPMPMAFDYAVMAAALAGMGAAVMRAWASDGKEAGTSHAE